MQFNFELLFQTLNRDMQAFLPEMLLCATIVLLLLLRLFSFLDRVHLGWVALLCTLGLFTLSLAQWTGYGLPGPEGYKPSLKEARSQLEEAQSAKPLLDVEQIRVARNKVQDAEQGRNLAVSCYSNMLVYDRLTLFLRLFLFGVATLVIWLSLVTGIPDREDSADFYVLLLGATLGMLLMASANHLLMIYLAVEMASLPSYALAGFLKGRRTSSEAALKYVVYGGGASGVMLYGISLLAGKFGTASLPDLAVGFVTVMHPVGTQGVVLDPVLILGALFFLIGVAFKVATVPFHFWCPDVFEGAASEVAGFLSVASKGAALALLARVTLTLAGLDPLVEAGKTAWIQLVHYLLPTLAILAALTVTFGNLAAYRQTNLKRLLAYSSIAHAGYMMMGLATLTRVGTSAVLFYLVAYLFMNLGAFAVVAFLRNATGSEELSSFRGLIRRAPWMVITLSIFLLSLLGIPPLIGFTAKFQLFLALYESAQMYLNLGEQGLSMTLYILLAVAGLNTILSAFYYLKVLRVLIMESKLEDIEGKEPVPVAEPRAAVLYATLLALVVVALGVGFNPLATASQTGVERFARRPLVNAEVKP